MSTLRVAGLVAGYGDADILHGMSLDVGPNQIVTLIGPNGAGKSTVLRAIMGFLRPRAGTVTLDDRDLAGRSPEAIVEAGLGYVPQVSNVFARLTVREHLKLARRPKARDVDYVLDLFPMLTPHLARMAGVLSGGERQMLAVARALVLRPTLVLLDEPSAALAPQVVQVVFDRIVAVAKSGVAVLLVEQNVKAALPISDTAYALQMGRNALSGPGPAILADPRLHDVYLGKSFGSHDQGFQRSD